MYAMQAVSLMRSEKWRSIAIDSGTPSVRTLPINQAEPLPHYSSRRASIGWMRRPCRTGPIAAITPSVIISKTTSGSSIAR